MTKALAIGLFIIIAVIFKETTLFLVLGMLPTLALFAIDKTIGKSRTICVGAMNFAGCFPYLLEFWTSQGLHSFENIMSYFTVQNFIIIFLLAAGGYAIDAAVTGITATILVQRSEARLKRIKKEQENLIKRWGEKVTGLYELDDYGFPVRPIPEVPAEAEAAEEASASKE